jgi:hypothetical protein
MTNQMEMQYTCYYCGFDFPTNMFVSKLSDIWEINSSGKVIWIEKKYCSGDGTLRCSEVDTTTRRGAMYEAWLDDPTIIDACDIQSE